MYDYPDIFLPQNSDGKLCLQKVKGLETVNQSRFTSAILVQFLTPCSLRMKYTHKRTLITMIHFYEMNLLSLL